LPADLDPRSGEFTLDQETAITVSDPGNAELSGAVERWVAGIRERTGLPLPIRDPSPGRTTNQIRVELTTDMNESMASPAGRAAAPPGGAGFAGTVEDLPGTEAEAYEMVVRDGAVELKAEGAPGVFYGLLTLGQLLRSTGAPPSWIIPAVEIDDVPRFPYRGMHLDVGRHFFPVEFIKRYIDLLAAHKMNVFHWHLTEDQGWRLEIKGYPTLTEVGSCRRETILEKNFDPYVGDGIEYCGFYTQEEAREIVAYARERFVMVMPEIEMPGHSVAALAAYPELACTPGPFQVYTRWGVTRDIYCPKEETFEFLENVLSEVLDIFPSRFIHIGGDEAPKTAWEESELAQEVMRREGLTDEDELQSWFIRRIEAFLNANDRRLMGWDEILEGGLAPDATVMSWRGMAGGIQAAQEGHDVVMTPTGYAYFDYYQGDTLQEPLAIGGFLPLERVYTLEPVPAELSQHEARHILGAQGNLWTEYIGTSEYAEYMVLPRMLAMAEVDWSPAEARDWPTFSRRLGRELLNLDQQGFNFRIPDVSGLENDRLTLDDSILVELAGGVEGSAIHYTLDGSVPNAGSPTYGGPFFIPLDEAGAEVTARVILEDGREGAFKRARLSHTRLLAPVALPWATRAQGLSMRGFSGTFSSVQSLEDGNPADVTLWGGDRGPVVPGVTLPQGAPASSFGLILDGFIRVPAKGIYTFYLSSDDGSRLSVGGRVLVDHDGPHSMSVQAGQIALHKGWHALEVRYFQGGGGKDLRLEVEGPGLARREVPAYWFAHQEVPGSGEGRRP